MITLYSADCPHCRVLTNVLNEKHIQYSLVNNIQEIMSFGEKYNIKSIPILDIDGNVMDFPTAYNWALNQ